MESVALLCLCSLFGQSTPALADIGPAPAFALVDQDGKPLSTGDLRGKAVVVSFIYTTCGGVCPATTHKMFTIQEALKKEGLWNGKIQFISISLDPERDTPDVLKRYAAAYDSDLAAWHFLTGEPKDVARVVNDWGMWARKNEQGILDHPSRIFLVDPRGRIREIYSLEFLNPETVLSDAREVLTENR